MAITTLFEHKITKEQKQATTILSIGTFLEAFDLYLYIHMAFMLEKIFFPPGFENNWVFSNLALCSAFVFRPLGAVVFGWLGDNLGRKSIIYITTIMTAAACLITASLPTYEQWGALSAYILLICRILQNVVSQCELQGARLYLAETVKGSTNQSFLSGIAAGIGIFGRFAAIGTANIVINLGGNSWRGVFLAGATVALIGMYARASLKEAEEFIEAKKRFVAAKKQGIYKISIANLNKKDLASFFILRCGEVLAMFMVYRYSPALINNLAKDTEVLNYVTLVGACDALTVLLFQAIIPFFNPIKIARFFTTMCLPLYIAIPILLTKFPSVKTIVLLQIACVIFFISDYPGSPMVYLRFPTLHRFKIILLVSGCASAFMWPLCTFGSAFLTARFSHYGLYVIYMPITILSIIAINYFVKVTTKKSEDDIKKTRLENA
jgi:MHS family proline/betaine transporter-like MFS transporter